MNTEQARKQERDAIVAWLRVRVTARRWFKIYRFDVMSWLLFPGVKWLNWQLSTIADAIERGQHLEGQA